MKKFAFLGAIVAMLIPSVLQGQMAFAIDELLPVELVQESADSAYFEAHWYYTPNQNWTVEYQYEVTRSTGEMVFSGQIPNTMFAFALPREEADTQYGFRVRVMRLAPSARSGPWSGDTFTVPARAIDMIYALAAPSTTPVVVPHDPSFETDKGTLWMEFTPDRVTDRQGLFCKDASGYGTGGHLCVALVNGQIEARIQSDTTTEAEITAGMVVDSTLNQVAIEFGTAGFRLWVNGAMVASSPFNGGITGNAEALRIGANAQSAPAGSEEWDFPLSGTMEVVELYNGVYDFSGRWGDVPLPPPGPVDSVTVIRVASLRVWRNPNHLDSATIQFDLAPAGYRYVDYRLDPPQKERLMYEVWIDGAQVSWAADADSGVGDCSLMPGGECVNGEIIPVRPFRLS